MSVNLTSFIFSSSITLVIMKTKLSFLFVAWMTLFGLAHAQTQQEKKEKPLLTLACISDIHTERSLIDCANLNDIELRGSFLKTLARIKQDEQIDVMMLGGDCTSDATIPIENWQQVRSLIAQYTRQAFPSIASTPVIYITGNHDYEVANWDNIPKPYNAGDYYTFPMKEDIGVLTESESFYEDADNGELGKMTLLAAYHYVINGFDFVILNCGKNFFKSAWDYVYSVESVQWVADKLAEIYAENPDKTVFFALHVPFADSNSIREPAKGMAASPGEKLLKKTLSQYPNLIMLYGHDHGGDKAYTRRKTSQRVTHYDMNGNVIATTDDTHVDGATEDPENDEENAAPAFYLKNRANSLYLGYNTYNLAPVTSKTKITFTTAGVKGYNLKLDAENPSASSNSFVHIGTNGYFSGGDPSLLYVYELTGGSNTQAARTTTLEAGHAYMIVGQNGSNYYALSNATYNSGTSQRMQRVQVTLSSDLETLTLSAANDALLWEFEEIGQEESLKDRDWYIRSTASGEYLGFNPRNLGMVTDPTLVRVEVTNADNAAFALKVSGNGSEANGNYVISSSSGRFSANENKYPTYFYKVTKQDETGIEAEKTTHLNIDDSYLIVAENAKDQSQLYALTNEGYPSTSANRLVGLSVTDTDGKIKVAASQTKALWHMEEPVIEPAAPSFFSAFMGSMRYYYNTIDPGDMPVETPNIVQALMVYVYPDRVELHMKNYNRSGTINGITVNKELAPYISYRTIDVPNAVQGVELKDAHYETVDAYDLTGRAIPVSSALSRPHSFGGTRGGQGIHIINGRKVLQK